MNFATVHETCNSVEAREEAPPRGGGARKSRRGKARGPALFPKLVEPRQWNRSVALSIRYVHCYRRRKGTVPLSPRISYQPRHN